MQMMHLVSLTLHKWSEAAILFLLLQRENVTLTNKACHSWLTIVLIELHILSIGEQWPWTLIGG
jgi:hypothetical protein